MVSCNLLSCKTQLCFGAILRCLGLFGPESTTDWSYHHDTHSAIPSLSFSTLHPEESCWRPPSKFWDFLWNLVTMDHQGSDAVPLAEGFLSQWMAKNGQADLCKHHEMPSIIKHHVTISQSLPTPFNCSFHTQLLAFGFRDQVTSEHEYKSRKYKMGSSKSYLKCWGQFISYSLILQHTVAFGQPLQTKRQNWSDRYGCYQCKIDPHQDLDGFKQQEGKNRKHGKKTPWFGCLECNFPQVLTCPLCLWPPNTWALKPTSCISTMAGGIES